MESVWLSTNRGKIQRIQPGDDEKMKKEAAVNKRKCGFSSLSDDNRFEWIVDIIWGHREESIHL